MFNDHVVVPNTCSTNQVKFLYIISETGAHCKGMSIDYKNLIRLRN